MIDQHHLEAMLVQYQIVFVYDMHELFDIRYQSNHIDFAVKTNQDERETK